MTGTDDGGADDTETGDGRIDDDGADAPPPGNAPTYGDAWVYESITGAVPGIDLSPRAAVAVQFVLFEGLVVGLASVYDLWSTLPAGTAAVTIATVGSVFMQRIGATIRGTDVPEPYRRALFGSSIEVVLGLLAFVGLVTYLFVADTGTVTVLLLPVPASGAPLLVDLLGETPPAPAVFVLLLVLWDVCYRIGTGWWASVVAAWGVRRFAFEPATERALYRANRLTLAFAASQLVLVPFIWGHPLLVALLVGHVAAVGLVAGFAVVRVRSEKSVSRL